MKFRYEKYPLPREGRVWGPSLQRPVIPITLSSQAVVFPYEALIDSGADYCIFDAEIGAYLGIDVSKGKRVQFGGVQLVESATSYLHRVSIGVGGYEYDTTVGFSYDLAAYSHGLLGQHGFFDHFYVGFDFQKGQIDIKPKKKKV